MPSFRCSVRQFLCSTSGAVTVDWVVLAGAVVGIGITSVAAVRTGVVDLGGGIDSSLSGASVAAPATLGSGVYEHSLLSVPQSTYDSWMTTLSSFDSTQLVNLYTTLSNMIPGYISSGNSNTAGLYIDLLAATQESIDANGLSRADGIPSVGTFVDQYNTAYG